MRSKFEQARDFSKTHLWTENWIYKPSILPFLAPNCLPVPINVQLTEIYSLCCRIHTPNSLCPLSQLLCQHHHSSLPAGLFKLLICFGFLFDSRKPFTAHAALGMSGLRRKLLKSNYKLVFIFSPCSF